MVHVAGFFNVLWTNRGKFPLTQNLSLDDFPFQANGLFSKSNCYHVNSREDIPWMYHPKSFWGESTQLRLLLLLKAPFILGSFVVYQPCAADSGWQSMFVTRSNQSAFISDRCVFSYYKCVFIYVTEWYINNVTYNFMYDYRKVKLFIPGQHICIFPQEVLWPFQPVQDFVYDEYQVISNWRKTPW